MKQSLQCIWYGDSDGAVPSVGGGVCSAHGSQADGIRAPCERRPKAPLLDLGAFVEAVAGFHDSTAFEGSAKKAFDI